jgi:sensor histidine kinase YesM
MSPLSHKINKNYLKHIFAWVAYALFFHFTNLLTKPENKLFFAFLYLIPFIATFYISLFCLNLYKEKGVVWSVASFFIVFFIMASLGYLYIYFILPEFEVVIYTTKAFKPFLQEALSGYFRFFTFALLFFYLGKAEENAYKVHRLEQQEMMAQQEKLKTEYALLRSQVNPHFLHNTLNALFSQALPLSQNLADNILKLSSLMRYSMESMDGEGGCVLVQKELEHLKTLIEVHKLRFGDTGCIVFKVEGEIDQQLVPPLSFITIAENAFKYGDLSSPETPLMIIVKLANDKIVFTCRNKIKAKPLLFSSSNIGISNLSKRLDLTFPNRYQMSGKVINSIYHFELVIF